jgi:hypothetical protein
MNVLFLIPSAICAAAAAFLCYKERDGWGWFLFAALLLGSAAMGHLQEIIR